MTDSASMVVGGYQLVTLAEVLATGGKLSVAQALGVMRGPLRGLALAHSRGIVHGEISASKILLDTAGTSRLIDFGFGGRPSADRHLADRSTEAAGGPPSPRSDVHAVAVVLVHLLTGETDAPPDLDRVDAGIRPVLRIALAPDPADRYVDAAAFLEALDDAAARTYGETWWTTAGVGALVADAVAGGSGAPASPKGTGLLGSKALLGGASAAGVAAAGTIAFVALQGGTGPAPEPEPAVVGFRSDAGVCEAIEPIVRDLLGDVRYRVDAAPGERYAGHRSAPITAVGRECDYGTRADPYARGDPGRLVAVNVATDQRSYRVDTVYADPEPPGDRQIRCDEVDAGGFDGAVACSLAAGPRARVVFVVDLGDQKALKCSYAAPAAPRGTVAAGTRMCADVAGEIGIYR